MGDPKRIKLVAADLVAHFEKCVEAMDGKAMIVCMSRRIAVDMYNVLIALRPDWAGAKDDDGEAEKGKACVVKVSVPPTLTSSWRSIPTAGCIATATGTSRSWWGRFRRSKKPATVDSAAS